MLLWDLSSAFDNINIDILCKKLEAYGFDELTVSWFEAFLKNRSQKVKINGSHSKTNKLYSGVPQGGIISTLIYVLFVADFEDWLVHAVATTYADDTQTTVTGMSIEEVKVKLECDAKNVLRFMASNVLVANPTKTSFMLINSQIKSSDIKIGDTTVTQVESSKLLGMPMDANLKWSSHFQAKGGLKSALNKRLFLLRRLKNHICKDKLKNVASALWLSKARYGLQLCGQVRTHSTAPTNSNLLSLQRAQNKMLRVILNKPYGDQTSAESLLGEAGFKSINQINAEIKLTEIWKSCNIDNYPVKFQKHVALNGMATRSVTSGDLIEFGKIPATIKSFHGDGSRLWNRCPSAIKESENIYQAKKNINIFIKTLPV